MSTYSVAAIAGDGIGQEVLPAAVRVLDELGRLFDFEFRWTYLPWSCEYYLETGKMMDDDGLERLASHDSIFLGAVGFPGVEDHISLWGLLIPIRREFRQYANVRPVRSFAGVRSPLRADLAAGIDMVIVRENNEGEYSSIGGRIYQGENEDMALQTAVFTRRGVERIARYAFELASSRRGHVTSATKSNGIIHTMPFWDEMVAGVAEAFPAVRWEKMHADALAAQFVLSPGRFDVVVGSNLFGDLLSDLSAGVTGSIGIAPSANLNPHRSFPSMFEPVHGSAPDIAGKGVANPIGQIWSGEMMLRHLGEVPAADALFSAMEEVLNAGTSLTRDLGGTAGTAETTDAVIEALHRVVR